MATRFAELNRNMSPERRARIAARVREALDAMPLDKMRKARDLTQTDLAHRMGVAQSEISKIEGRSDLYLSTLRQYVESLGGELVLRAEFPEGDINIEI